MVRRRHTGNRDATVKESDSVAPGFVIDALTEVGGVALMTADHGNPEFMR